MTSKSADKPIPLWFIILGFIFFLLVVGWFISPEDTATSGPQQVEASVSSQELDSLKERARPAVALYTSFPANISKETLLKQLASHISPQALEGVRQNWQGEVPSTLKVASVPAKVQFVKEPVLSAPTRVVIRAEAERVATFSRTPPQTTYPIVDVTFERETTTSPWAITLLQETGLAAGRGVG